MTHTNSQTQDNWLPTDTILVYNAFLSSLFRHIRLLDILYNGSCDFTDLLFIGLNNGNSVFIFTCKVLHIKNKT